MSFLSRANVRAFHENLNRIHTELTLNVIQLLLNKTMPPFQPLPMPKVDQS